MRLIIACAAVVLLASVVDVAKPKRKGKKVNVREAFENANITENLNITAPEKALEVNYETAKVNFGNIIYQSETTEVPEISCDVNTDCYYTLVVIDDNFYGSDDEECIIPLLNGLFMNILNFDLTNAFVAAKFIGPNPLPLTSIHYYSYLLYKQKGIIDTSCNPTPSFELDRLGFNITQLVINYTLVGPVCGNFHGAIFPDNLEETCATYCQS